MQDLTPEPWVSTVRRTVWNGNQELAEIQMPATDSTASSTIENDTLAIVRSVPGTGDSFYDANRLYGQVLYVDGLETDQPLAITRNHYADASSTTGSETYAVYAPFSVIPLWNSQGRADRSVVGGTAAPGQDGVCVDGGVTRCASVYLDLGVFPYARTGAEMGSWNGTLLIDKADATGTYYRRNRSYDPATARFTQEDPIGLAGGMNAYGFAGGDPANYSDPFGLSCEDAHGRDAPCPDKDKVAQWMQENAGAQSQAKCATFCRRGLEAGGFDSFGRPRDAGDYGPFLRSRGAEVVSEEDYVPERGDIVVFQKTKVHPAGHIEIYDGKEWSSDFKQKHMVPYRDPRSAGAHTIYRFPDN